MAAAEEAEEAADVREDMQGRSFSCCRCCRLAGMLVLGLRYQGGVRVIELLGVRHGEVGMRMKTGRAGGCGRSKQIPGQEEDDQGLMRTKKKKKSKDNR